MGNGPAWTVDAVQWEELDVKVSEALKAGAGRFAAKNLMQFMRMQRGTKMEVRKLEITVRQVGSDDVGMSMLEGQRST